MPVARHAALRQRTAVCCRRSAATAGPRSTSIPPATSTSPVCARTAPRRWRKYDAAGRRLWTAPLSACRRLPRPPPGGRRLVGRGHRRRHGARRELNDGGYLTIRFAADGRELFRHEFDGRDDPGQHDEVAALAIDSQRRGAGHRDVVERLRRTRRHGHGHRHAAVRRRRGARARAARAPSRLEAVAQSKSQIRLRWQDDSASEDGFRIERCAGAGCTDFVHVATVGPRRDELRRRRARAQHDVHVPRASVRRQRRVGLLRHRRREDTAQLRAQIGLRRQGGGLSVWCIPRATRGLSLLHPGISFSQTIGEHRACPSVTTRFSDAKARRTPQEGRLGGAARARRGRVRRGARRVCRQRVGAVPAPR